MAEENKTKQEMQEVEEVGGENLDEISGGHIFHATGKAADPDHRWEVVHPITGEVVARCRTKQQAKAFCISHNIPTDRIFLYKTMKNMQDDYEQGQYNEFTFNRHKY